MGLSQGELVDIWKQTKQTIFFVTHDVEEAIQLSDRVIVRTQEPEGVLYIVILTCHVHGQGRRKHLVAIMKRYSSASELFCGHLFIRIDSIL